MFEKRWAAVSPQSFTSNGTTNGQLTVADSSVFKVKQQVNVSSNTLSNLNLEIKSIPDDVTILVGPLAANIFTYSDISAYLVADGANIWAIEQKRSSVPVEEINRAVYEEEPVVAERVILIDKHGRKIDSSNPLPTTATISGDVTIGTDGFDLSSPDSMLATGSEDGTKTGIKHAVRVDSELDLRVGISDGANKANVNVSGELSVKDADSQSLLTSINNKLIAGVLTTGTEDGTTTGVPHVFVNNLRKMITSAHDVVPTYTYADFGTKDQRITRIDYVSATFPGFIARRDFNYVLDTGRYRRINGPWSIV